MRNIKKTEEEPMKNAFKELVERHKPSNTLDRKIMASASSTMTAISMLDLFSIKPIETVISVCENKK